MDKEKMTKDDIIAPFSSGDVSGSYCIRKMDLFAISTPKVADNLSKDEAERIKNEIQKKSIEKTGCVVPIFFVSEV